MTRTARTTASCVLRFVLITPQRKFTIVHKAKFQGLALTTITIATTPTRSSILTIYIIVSIVVGILMCCCSGFIAYERNSFSMHGTCGEGELIVKHLTTPLIYCELSKWHAKICKLFLQFGDGTNLASYGKTSMSFYIEATTKYKFISHQSQQPAITNYQLWFFMVLIQ